MKCTKEIINLIEYFSISSHIIKDKIDINDEINNIHIYKIINKSLLSLNTYLQEISDDIIDTDDINEIIEENIDYLVEQKIKYIKKHFDEEMRNIEYENMINKWNSFEVGTKTIENGYEKLKEDIQNLSEKVKFEYEEKNDTEIKGKKNQLAINDYRKNIIDNLYELDKNGMKIIETSFLKIKEKIQNLKCSFNRYEKKYKKVIEENMKILDKNEKQVFLGMLEFGSYNIAKIIVEKARERNKTNKRKTPTSITPTRKSKRKK